jgi:hypothetical protein
VLILLLLFFVEFPMTADAGGFRIGGIVVVVVTVVTDELNGVVVVVVVVSAPVWLGGICFFTFVQVRLRSGFSRVFE